MSRAPWIVLVLSVDTRTVRVEHRLCILFLAHPFENENIHHCCDNSYPVCLHLELEGDGICTGDAASECSLLMLPMAIPTIRSDKK